jgi:hypothetical protein
MTCIDAVRSADEGDVSLSEVMSMRDRSASDRASGDAERPSASSRMNVVRSCFQAFQYK